MTFQGSVITEQGVTFAVMLVQEYVVDSPTERDNTLAWATRFFCVPTVLMTDRRYRTWGRPDIVNFLTNVHPSRIPWRRYTVAA